MSGINYDWVTRISRMKPEPGRTVNNMENSYWYGPGDYDRKRDFSIPARGVASWNMSGEFTLYNSVRFPSVRFTRMSQVIATHNIYIDIEGIIFRTYDPNDMLKTDGQSYFKCIKIKNREYYNSWSYSMKLIKGEPVSGFMNLIRAESLNPKIYDYAMFNSFDKGDLFYDIMTGDVIAHGTEINPLVAHELGIKSNIIMAPHDFLGGKNIKSMLPGGYK